MAKVEIPWVDSLPENGSPNNLGTNLVYKYTEPRGLFECYADGLWRAVGGTQIATKTLDNNQIKALPTTPIEILPGPGAGKAYIIDKVVVVADTSANAYTNVDAETANPLTFIYEFGLSIATFPQFLLTSGEKDVVMRSVGGDNYFGDVYNGFDNGRILVLANNNDANYIGGDPNNTMKLIVYYSTIEL